MSKHKVGDVVSRLRNLIKAVRQDAFLTDRFIYSVVLKHARWLMRREDSSNKIMSHAAIFETLDYVYTVEVDKVEAGCIGVSSSTFFTRTEDKMDMFMQGYWGPMIRNVTSLDGSVQMISTTPSRYAALSKSKNFKFNKNVYYWYLNDYLYFPNVDWEAVRIDAIVQGDISRYKCADCNKKDFSCRIRQEMLFGMPEYLLAEMETNVLKELGLMFQLPSDPAPIDKQNPVR